MKIKVAIMGSGFGLYGLLSAFNKIEGCEVQSICADNHERLKNYWKDKNPDKIYTDWKQMLEKEKPDAVAIAVIPKHQFEIAKYALINKIAVFAEKPLTTSVETSLQLCRLAKEKNLPNMVDFIFPEIPEWVEAKKIISRGAIGKIIAMDVDWSFLSYDLKNNIDSWKTDVGQGGGALSFFFSHVFYYLENFMGRIEKLECATSASKKSKNHGETFVSIIAKFQNGCVGNVRLNIGYIGPQKHYIEFQGENGTLLLQNNSDSVVDNFELILKTEQGIKNIKPSASYNILAGELEDPRIKPVSAIADRFVNWCNSGIAAKPDFQDGLRVQELIEASRISNSKLFTKYE